MHKDSLGNRSELEAKRKLMKGQEESEPIRVSISLTPISKSFTSDVKGTS